MEVKMLSGIRRFLVELVVFAWNWVWDIIDPVENEEFYKKIDRDYFPD